MNGQRATRAERRRAERENRVRARCAPQPAQAADNPRRGPRLGAAAVAIMLGAAVAAQKSHR